MRKLFPSFRRKPESRLPNIFWTPAFSGVTKWVDGILLWSCNWSRFFRTAPITTAAHGQTPGSRPGKAGGLPFSGYRVAVDHHRRDLEAGPVHQLPGIELVHEA